jgi:hypothetical protein
MNRTASSNPFPQLPRITKRALASALVTATVVLAGCASAPLSFINDRYVEDKQILNRFPLRVVAIDGQYTSFSPVPVAPGMHQLLLAAAPVAGFRVPPEKTYAFNIAPCTRYYLAAQRTSPLVQDWDLVVERTYPVGGCDPARELEKAKTVAVSALTPERSSVIETASTPLAQIAPR